MADPEEIENVAAEIVARTVGEVGADVEASRIGAAVAGVEEILRRERSAEVSWYRHRISRLMVAAGFSRRTCKSCGVRIYWVRTVSGAPAPYTVDGVSHFADCPNANAHRRRTGKEKS